MRYEVSVRVMPLEELLDPQGKAIGDLLKGQGFDKVSGFRAGKHYQFELEASDEDAARQVVNRVCSTVLSNPVMEGFEFKLRPRS